MRKNILRVMGFLLLVVFLHEPLPSAPTLGQTARLAALCKVWGFLKYHYSPADSNDLDWDKILVDAVPKIRDNADKTAFNHEILMLTRAIGFHKFGPPSEAGPAAQNIVDYSWMEDAGVFFPATTRLLQDLKSHFRPGISSYLTPFPAGNFDFVHDNAYADVSKMSDGIALLAMFRFWNIIEYFFPYKNVMDEKWDDVLEEFIPRFLKEGKYTTSYNLVMREFTARINDSHAGLSSPVFNSYWGSSYWGTLHPGFKTGWVEGKTIVLKIFPSYLGKADVRVGDVVTHLNDRPIETIRQERRRFVPGSNEPRIQYNLDQIIFVNKNWSVSLRIDRDGQAVQCSAPCTSMSNLYNEEQNSQSREIFRILPGNIGYVNMGMLTTADVSPVTAQLKDSRAIIFDIRNYPKGTLYELGKFLNPQKREFVRFMIPDPSYPGIFYSDDVLSIGPDSFNPDYFKGLVILLANETTLSHAEFTCMGLQTAPTATIIGSQTAGADGNVSDVYLPQGVTVRFTGLGVFYPDGRPTQRIGIVPDIVVHPTIAGIRDGRDEVLERALFFIENNR